jgi:hypothetical protein
LTPRWLDSISIHQYFARYREAALRVLLNILRNIVDSETSSWNMSPQSFKMIEILIGQLFRSHFAAGCVYANMATFGH